MTEPTAGLSGPPWGPAGPDPYGSATPVPVATDSTPGIVRPDGSTITIEDGVISAAGAGASALLSKSFSFTADQIATCNSVPVQFMEAAPEGYYYAPCGASAVATPGTTSPNLSQAFGLFFNPGGELQLGPVDNGAMTTAMQASDADNGGVWNALYGNQQSAQLPSYGGPISLYAASTDPGSGTISVSGQFYYFLVPIP